MVNMYVREIKSINFCTVKKSRKTSTQVYVQKHCT